MRYAILLVALLILTGCQSREERQAWEAGRIECRARCKPYLSGWVKIVNFGGKNQHAVCHCDARTIVR
jgi:hypothetical protein